MKRLTLTAAIHPYTGYGLHAIQLVRQIERLTSTYMSIRTTSVSEAFGAKVPADIRSRIVAGPQPEDWELLLHPPNNFCPTPGKRTAWLTMHESTRLPPMGANLLNRAEVVIVPNDWNASCFSACGVDRPIRVVPLGINEEAFHWRPLPDYINGLCVFGTAGRMAHGGVRKGINEVIDLFQQAFPIARDVRLKVKCFGDCPVTKVEDDRIELVQGFLTEEQMAEWYCGLHCFVSAAKAEGWGLHQNEALATGRPVISIKFGGTQEFFDQSVGWEIPWRLEPGHGTYEGCGCWAEPDETAIIEAMREVYSNRTEAACRGARAVEKVKHLTWENHAKRLIAVLEEFGVL